MSKEREIVIALIGQPNTGKSTLFNILTRGNVHVGNWPGKTVEINLGTVTYKDYKLTFIDFPGVYGLSSSSIEEIITKNYLMITQCLKYCTFKQVCPFSKKFTNIKIPDVIVILTDATSLRKSLYLAISVMEMTSNVVLVVNKIDMCSVDVEKLSKILNVPVIPISALKNWGIDKLLEAIISVYEGKVKTRPIEVPYHSLEVYLSKASEIMRKLSLPVEKYSSRWIFMRLLEDDEDIINILRSINVEVYNELLKIVHEVKSKISNILDLIVKYRYDFIDKILEKINYKYTPKLSRIDKIFISRIGIFLSISILLTIFLTAFTVNTGFPLSTLLRLLGNHELADLVESYAISSILDNVLSSIIESVRIENPVIHGLIIDGILSGVSTVIVFTPLIFIIMLLISALEDSGLFVRLVWSFEPILSKFGLSSRIILILLTSLGCNVAGVLATRTVLSTRERIALLYTLSFIPCQARLIVILALSSIIFNNMLKAILLVSSIYIIGIILYVTLSSIIVKYVFKEESVSVIDVPTIKRPSLRVITWNSWISTKEFLKKAGTIIVLLSAITWVFTHFNIHGYVENVNESFAVIIGEFLRPLLILINITTDIIWKIGLILINGFIAKEGLLATIASLGTSLEESWSSLSLTLEQEIALTFFMMLYIPCLATVGAVYKEVKSVKITLSVVLFTILVALTVMYLTYLILLAL